MRGDSKKIEASTVRPGGILVPLRHHHPPVSPPGDAWRRDMQHVERLTQGGRLHEALQLCDRIATRSDEACYHAAIARGNILLELGDPAGALSCFESVADPGTPDAQIDCARGIALFELCYLPEAEGALRSAIRGNPDLAEAHFVLGLVAELLGTGDEGEYFRRARRLAPERYCLPTPRSRQSFQGLVDLALAALPVPARAALHRIAVVVSELPTPGDLARSDPPASPTALGLFVGNETTDRGPEAQSLPVILLFKRNLERALPDDVDLVREIRSTVLHEIGHALGWSEEQLQGEDLLL